MRLLTFRSGGDTRAGRLEGDEVVELQESDVGRLLEGGPERMAAAAATTGPRHRLSDLRLAPVVGRPEKIICVGHNYQAHIRELGNQPPSHPTLFAKFSRALVGPRDPITLPHASERVDWEVELALVIGCHLRHATGDQAREAIAGWTILNDISARDWQHRTSQFLQGKTFERTTPVGPWLVTREELDAGDLVLRCEVDGRVMQEARTSDMLFKPAELVAYTSTIVTLAPGDLISTGTPSGVGAGRRPEVYLRPGQVVRSTIEGIGEMVNRCIEEPHP